MGIKIGDVDVAQEIIRSEFKLGVINKIVEWILQNATLRAPLTQEQVNGFRKEVLDELKKKYPNMGIELKGDGE